MGAVSSGGDSQGNYQRFNYTALTGLSSRVETSAALSLDPSLLAVEPDVIGQGSYGIVYKGTYQGQEVVRV
jgi:hypothetical protein